MPTDSNILVDLLKQGSLPVAVIFMMFMFIKVLWKKQEELNREIWKKQEEYYNKMTSLIEASLKNGSCIEKNNEILMEILSRVNDLYLNNNNLVGQQPIRQGGMKPPRKQKVS